MAEAQGALEYLIIISVTLAIVAIITMVVVNSYYAQSSDYAYNACREAASRCKMAISGNPSEPCLFCNSACNYSNGTEIFTNAANCCKRGEPDKIYSNAPGCVSPYCGDGSTFGSEACDPPGSSCGTAGTCSFNCLTCVEPPPTIICGDGNINSPEVCDPPSSSCGTGGTCSSNCLTCVEPPVLCPNGVINLPEQCDPPNDCACPGQCKPDCTCPTISFQESLIGNTYDIQGSIMSVAIGDADNDGTSEPVVSVNYGFMQSVNGIMIYNLAYTGHNFIASDVERGVYGGPVAVGNADNQIGNEIIAASASRSSITNYTLKMYKYSGSWIGTNISTVSHPILSTAIGDADNDGKNETALVTYVASPVIPENATRIYDYNSSSGKWIETNISVTTCGCSVTSVAIGDADNQPGNELVTASENGAIDIYSYSGGWTTKYHFFTGTYGDLFLAIGDADNQPGNEMIIGASGQLFMYKYKSGAWVKTTIPSTATGIFNSVAIGDADNDSYNEIVLGTSNNQLKMYDYLCSQWKETTISGPDRSINSVAIGSIDSELGNEIVIGLNQGAPSLDNSPRMYKRV